MSALALSALTLWAVALGDTRATALLNQLAANAIIPTASPPNPPGYNRRGWIGGMCQKGLGVHTWSCCNMSSVSLCDQASVCYEYQP